MLKYRPHLDDIVRPALVKKDPMHRAELHKNESPFAPGDIVEGFDDGSLDLRRYPDPYPLYEILAKVSGCDIHQLHLTFGSEQAIRFGFEIMLDPGDEVLYLNPSFAMIDVFARQFKAQKNILDYGDLLHMPANKIIEAINPATRLVALPNPNNPTGSLIELEDICAIIEKCEEVGALFLLDEAYQPYGDIGSIELINRYQNILITRTFSKAWGLASARVGYILSTPEIIQLVRKVKPIDELPGPSIALAIKALQHPEILERNVAQVKKWKDEFNQLKMKNATMVPSHGNFILIKIDDSHFERVCQWFSDNDIIINSAKWFEKNTVTINPTMGHPCLQNHIRFCVGPDDIMSLILNYFKNDL